MTEKQNLKKEKDSEFIQSFKNENKAWDKDNQAWWDWYVSLADNSNSNIDKSLLELPKSIKVKYLSKNDLKKLLSSPSRLTKNNIEP